mmetsp:Transcript_92985/g.240245  ORF Transcript_92985/g.240245 Transcript_92985/m.240245 type:complete len:339 (-) Transcript_92985:325-1341(-)
MVCQLDTSAIMFATGPSRVQPKAASPKAPSLSNAGSYLSFSSAETLTPESSAGGRPSRASAVGTISPESRPSFAPGKASVQNSSTATLDDIARQASEDGLSARRYPMRSQLRISTGELRRRKYTSPADRPRSPKARAQGWPLPGASAGADYAREVEASLARSRPQASEAACTPGAAQPARLCSKGSGGQPVAGMVRGESSAAPSITDGGSTPAGPEQDETEVLIEGPLQQRALLVFWRWRWCVLDRHELRVYPNEEASLLMPEKPLERHSVGALNVAPDLHLPSVLVVAGAAGGDPLLFLRTGPGLRWEELASSTLWLRAFASASKRSSAAFGRGARR